MRFHRSLFLLASIALAAAAPAAAQGRLDSALRNTMTDNFRTAAAQHRVTADLATVGLTSTRFLFAGAVAVTPVDGLDGILRGEPYALAYFDGTGTTVARGYYRLAIGSDGSALLLTATGATAGRGRAGFDLVANPGTPYCEFDPDPGDDDVVCLNCLYGDWVVSSCFTIFF